MRDIISGLLSLLIFFNTYWFELVRNQERFTYFQLKETSAFALDTGAASRSRISYSVSTAAGKLIQNGGECNIVPVSGREFLVPSHCIKGNSKEIYLSEYGYQEVQYIGGASEQLKDDQEVILRVALINSIFLPGMTKRSFKNPSKHTLVSFGEGYANRSCEVREINRRFNFLTYDCSSSPGDSGRILYQNGKPIGIHIGRLTDDNLAVASIRDGLSQEFLQIYGDRFEPEFKIRCCKKATKAVKKLVDNVQNAGQAVVDGTGRLLNDAGKALEDGFKTVVERTVSEIENLKKDINSLPKVFSTNYVEAKLGEIKLPNLPSLTLSLPQVKFDWPKIDVNLGQLGNLSNLLPPGLATGTVCVTVEWCVLVAVIVVVCVVVGGCQGFGSGGSSSSGGNDETSEFCGAIRQIDDRKRCVEDLKRALTDLRGKRLEVLSRMTPWLDKQAKLIGNE